MKQVAIILVAACSFVAGCASYSERVVEKPVPARTAERTVVYDNTAPIPTQTTTVYTTRYEVAIVKLFVILAVSSVTAACSIQSERVVEKPVPAEGAVVYTR